MFTLNDDLSIYVTRGDTVFFTVMADENGIPYFFEAGDVLRMKIFGKKDAESVVMEKCFPVTARTDRFTILLTEEDTKIGEVISKPRDYWYEIELNPFTNPQTLIGYDEDGPKVFKLFPEGQDSEIPEIKPEDIPIVDNELDMTSNRPVQNQAIARAIVNIAAACKVTEQEVKEKAKELESSATRIDAAMAVERARVDNLIANPASDDAEIVDVRVGADSVVYESAGTAVRSQIGVIREQFTNSLSETDNALNPLLCKNNTALSTAEGKESTNSSHWITGLIPVNGFDKVISNKLMYKCCCYDRDLNFLKVADSSSNSNVALLEENTAFVKIQYEQSNVPFANRYEVIARVCSEAEPVPVVIHKPHKASGYKDILDGAVSLSKMHSSYTKVITLELLKAGVLPFVLEDFVIGGINAADGAFVVTGTQRIVLKKPFYIPKGTSMNFGTNLARILYYEENGVYSGVYDNNLTSKYFDKDCYVILSIANADNEELNDAKKQDIYNSISASYSANSTVLPIGEYVFSFGLNGVTYMSDHTMIKGKLYVINASSDDHATYAGVTVYSVDLASKTVAYEKTLQHNLGHANSIDYCEGNDCLILGNGSSDATLPGKIFILPNASQKTSWEYDDCIVIDVDWGIKTNVVWGEHNNEQFNIAYVITNNNANVRKILLGKDDNGFNGTYIVLGEWSVASGLDVNQGTVFRSGKLYEAIGHSQLWVSENTLNDDGTITQVQRKDVFVGSEGEVLTVPFSEGITIENDFAYVGGSNGRIYVYKI